MIYQVWFSESTLPVIPQEYLLAHKELAENWVFPVGEIVNNRMLVWCMTEDFEPIKEQLNAFGKDVIVCGARYEDGVWLEQYPKDQDEFDKYGADIGVAGGCSFNS